MLLKFSTISGVTSTIVMNIWQKKWNMYFFSQKYSISVMTKMFGLNFKNTEILKIIVLLHFEKATKLNFVFSD